VLQHHPHGDELVVRLKLLYPVLLADCVERSLVPVARTVPDDLTRFRVHAPAVRTHALLLRKATVLVAAHLNCNLWFDIWGRVGTTVSPQFDSLIDTIVAGGQALQDPAPGYSPVVVMSTRITIHLVFARKSSCFSRLLINTPTSVEVAVPALSLVIFLRELILAFRDEDIADFSSCLASSFQTHLDDELGSETTRATDQFLRAFGDNFSCFCVHTPSPIIAVTL